MINVDGRVTSVMVVGAPRQIVYGRGVASGVGDGYDSVVVATMEVPWRIVRDRLGEVDVECVFVESMDRSRVEAVADGLPDADAVIAAGGGAAIDMGKFIAWSKDVDLITVPTAITADAMVTPAIALRDRGYVHYTGFQPATRLVVDYGIVQSAPEELNRGGAEDVLSIHTALHDWKLAAEYGVETYHEGIAERARACLARLEEKKGEIRAVTEEGIRTLVTLYLEALDFCQLYGTARPEEGSEHYFAYNLERVTDAEFAHGPAVGLGVYLMSTLQENDPEGIAALMDDLGLEYGLDVLGVTVEDVRETLVTLPEYVDEDGLPYTVIDETGIDVSTADRLLDGLEA